MRNLSATLLFALALPVACTTASEATERPAPGHTGSESEALVPSDHTTVFAACDKGKTHDVSFERSPGGATEVSTKWVAEHGCNVRVIDVREQDELVGELGHIPGVEWVPMSRVAVAAKSWEHDEPIVIVCRSGRRSAKAASFLEDLGYENVASMTGGMLLWNSEKRGMSRTDDDFTPLLSEKHIAFYEAEVDGGATDEISQHLGSSVDIQWIKAASLVMNGSQSCVDGRDGHGIVGTPGGDAGEFVLTIATLESLEERALNDEELQSRFDEYLGAFGNFYMHTDDHALEALGDLLAKDPRFSEVKAELRDAGSIERFVRRPPRSLEDPLLEHLIKAEAVGCGHLKLMTLHPSEYGIRNDLVADYLRIYFRRLWQGETALQYVSLHGEHAEGAVLNVMLDGEVHAFTDVPTIAPLHKGTEVFVQHPEVNHWVREQHTTFLIEKEDWLAAHGIGKNEFLDALEKLAEQQLGATLRYLADGLPIYAVHFQGKDQYRVEGPLR